jgi:hypothetical protein
MPNIEIHGVKASMIKFGAPLYEVLRAAINEKLADAPYRDDVVISTYANEVIDRSGTDQPFLRLVAPSTSGAELEDIEKRLTDLNLDVEVLLLGHFTPRKDPKQPPMTFL